MQRMGQNQKLQKGTHTKSEKVTTSKISKKTNGIQTFMGSFLFAKRILEEENAFYKFQERALGFCACCRPASGNHSCCDTFATMKSSFLFKTFRFVLYLHQNCLIVSSISKMLLPCSFPTMIMQHRLPLHLQQPQFC